MKSEHNRPVALEDLLRLKRAERPPAEFWSEFDRKLRAKQLAALVEKRPWWQTWPQVFSFSGLNRHRVPLGAAAVVALTFLTVREYRAPAGASSNESVPPTEASASARVPGARMADASAEISTASTAAGALPESQFARAENATTGISPAIFAGAAQTSVDPAAEGGLAADSLAPDAGKFAALDSNIETSSPPARTIAATVVVASTADRGVAAASALLAAKTGFETRAMPEPTPARLAVDPLQQMTPPGDSRRSRLLTAMVSMASLEGSYRTTERAASRIAEEQLYDQIHRFGARGDRLQVKF